MCCYRIPEMKIQEGRVSIEEDVVIMSKAAKKKIVKTIFSLKPPLQYW